MEYITVYDPTMFKPTVILAKGILFALVFVVGGILLAVYKKFWTAGFMGKGLCILFIAVGCIICASCIIRYNDDTIYDAYKNSEYKILEGTVDEITHRDLGGRCIEVVINGITFDTSGLESYLYSADISDDKYLSSGNQVRLGYIDLGDIYDYYDKGSYAIMKLEVPYRHFAK